MEVLIWIVLSAIAAIIQWVVKANRQQPARVPLPPRRPPRAHPLDVLATQLSRGEVHETGLQERTVSGRHKGHAVAVIAKRPYKDSKPLEYRAAVSKQIRLLLLSVEFGGPSGQGYIQEFVRGEVLSTSAKVLDDPRVKRQLRILFKSMSIDTIHFEDGWIKALRRQTTTYDYRNNTATLKILDRLVGLARAADEALGKAEVKATLRYRKREGEKCPYCHDDLGSDLALVTCARCTTIHHEECFSELGHCTTMGCESKRSLPALQHKEGIALPLAMSLASCELCGAPMAGAVDAVCTSERCGASATEQKRHGREQALNRALTRRQQRGEIRLQSPSERLQMQSERRRRA